MSRLIIFVHLFAYVCAKGLPFVLIIIHSASSTSDLSSISLPSSPPVEVIDYRGFGLENRLFLASSHTLWGCAAGFSYPTTHSLASGPAIHSRVFAFWVATSARFRVQGVSQPIDNLQVVGLFGPTHSFILFPHFEASKLSHPFSLPPSRSCEGSGLATRESLLGFSFSGKVNALRALGMWQPVAFLRFRVFTAVEFFEGSGFGNHFIAVTVCGA